MGIFSNKSKTSDFSINVAYMGGIPHFASGFNAVSIDMEDSNNRIAITPRMGKDKPAYIGYEQITQVEVVTETEIIEKERNIIGRAIVGKLVFGDLGAQIGAISGTQTKKTTKVDKYLIINFHSLAEPNETKCLSLRIVGATMGLDKFLKRMKEKCYVEETPEYGNGYL